MFFGLSVRPLALLFTARFAPFPRSRLGRGKGSGTPGLVDTFSRSGVPCRWPWTLVTICVLASACSGKERPFADAAAAGASGASGAREGANDGSNSIAPPSAPGVEETPVDSTPIAVSGGSGVCDVDGNCECDESSEGCAPIALCAEGSSVCEVTCSGCLIEGQCVAPQALAADNPCQICDPTRDAAGWSSNDRVSCEDGLFCTTGDVCAGGQCTAAPRVCDDGVACNGTSTCDETLDACSAPASQCPAGTFCDVATDTCASTCAGCSIDGVCLTAGAERPGNPCFVCDPAQSTNAYSPSVGKVCGAAPSACSLQDTCDAAGVCQPNHAPVETACGNATANACDQPDACDGAGNCLTRTAPNASPCDDGSFCTVGDQCQGGQCVAIGNRNCGAGLACNEAADQCQCQGCVVGTQCFAAGAINNANSCDVCDPARSATAFSANVGASCGAGPTECSAQDTCNAQRQCVPNDLPAGTPCSSVVAGECQEDGRCSDSLAGRAPVLLADVARGVGGLVISGDSADSDLATSVAGGGDVNGDGIDDLVIGAPGQGVAPPGKAYVVFGRLGQAAISLADVEAGRGGFVIEAGPGITRLGADVQSVGDVNGDGLDDVLIGANGDSDFVVFGKRATVPVVTTDIAAGVGGGFALGAASDDGATGGNIGAAGDVNGDGLADIVVSVSGDQPGARVVFGKASATPVDLALTETTGFRVISPSALTVGGAGDVNGDGFDDVIVGRIAAGTPPTGAAYVVFGKANGAPVQISSIEAGVSGGFAMLGARASDQAGSHVNGAGDVNGDGLADVLVSAVFATSNGNQFAGRGYVVFGKANATPVQLSAIENGTAGGFSVDGLASNDNAGTGLLGPGDINGDGFGDVVVTAPQATRGGITSAGVIGVVFGKVDRNPVPLGELEEGGRGGFAILSNGVVGNSGQVVANADFNGDGRQDIIVGDVGGARVLVVFGQ